MKISRYRYRDLSIAKKLTLFTVLMVVLSGTIVTALVKSMFANAMLEVAQEQYVEKFDSISQNCLELFGDAQQMTNIVLTDENMQYFSVMYNNVRNFVKAWKSHWDSGKMNGV